MQVLLTGKMKCASSDNATITALGSCSVPLNSEGEGWGILKLQNLFPDKMSPGSPWRAGDPQSARAQFQEDVDGVQEIPKEGEEDRC